MENFKIIRKEPDGELIVAHNEETNKYFMVKAIEKAGEEEYKKVTRDFDFISKFAPKQDRKTAVKYIAFDKLNRYVVLNNNKKIKINSRDAFVVDLPVRSVQSKAVINDKPCVVEDFSRCEYMQTSVMHYEDGYEVLYSSKKFGEFIYNITTCSLSKTYDFIGPKDKNGFRLAKLSIEEKGQYVYLDSNYQECGKPFMYKISDIMGIQNTVLSDGEQFYTVNKNYKCNSVGYKSLKELQKVLKGSNKNNFYTENLKEHTATKDDIEQVEVEKE